MSHARIEVVSGPDSGLVAQLPVGGELTIGRGEGAGVQLGDPQVAARHCVLEHRLVGIVVHGGAGVVVDGVALAGQRLVASPRAELRLGDTLLLLTRTPSPLPTIPGVRLLEPLGSGSAASVYAGELLATGERVAIKLLEPQASGLTRLRFEREAELGERLSHPAIARILELRLDGERPCLIRELVPGESLADRLESGPLSCQRVLQIGIVMARALAYAHSQGVVHRDVKPGNVMLMPDGQPKLIDFDLAKQTASRPSSLAQLTQTGEGLGTLSYLAPEQLQGAREVDHRADVYGLGVTLYHALSGHPPFAEVEPEDYVDALLRRGPQPLATVAPDAPAQVVEALERAYALSPERRYPDAAHMSLVLAGCL